MLKKESEEDENGLRQARWELLRQVDSLLDQPMVFLSFAWIGLLILDLTGHNGVVRTLTYAIWGIFVLDFLIEILVAPDKAVYLRRHWLTVFSLALPALRILRVAQTLRFLRVTGTVRPVNLARLITSFSRGMGAVRTTLGRHGFGYVLALTVLITFAGAAGMVFFENPAALRSSGYVEAAEQGAGLHSYAEALWWTAMIITTMGSEYWPKTAEGRILCWLLAVYAFAIFGYITATIASFLIGRPPPDERMEREEEAPNIVRPEETK